MGDRPDDSHLPLEARVPAPSIATPSDLRPRDAGEIRWYRPTFAEVARLLGWRWIYFLPALFLIVLLIDAVWQVWMLPFVLVWWKLILIAVVLPTSHVINIARHILRSRKEPFCIHCGYDLSGLADSYTCPECGELYNFRLIEEYKRDPQWFIKRYEMHQDLPVRDAPFEARRSTRPRSRDGT